MVRCFGEKPTDLLLKTLCSMYRKACRWAHSIQQQPFPRLLFTQTPWYLSGSNVSPLLKIGNISPLFQTAGRQNSSRLNSFTRTLCSSDAVRPTGFWGFYYMECVCQFSQGDVRTKRVVVVFYDFFKKKSVILAQWFVGQL